MCTYTDNKVAPLQLLAMLIGSALKEASRFSKLAKAKPRLIAWYVSSAEWPGAWRTCTEESSGVTAAWTHAMA